MNYCTYCRSENVTALEHTIEDTEMARSLMRKSGDLIGAKKTDIKLPATFRLTVCHRCGKRKVDRVE